ncbi:MAG TPA: folylpolyglutamate synthase/dihydrofolate synthase family protein [Gemmatimonadaceae bacterium]|nr:folylpolyglutamate synthase/dihydrofolate synthase family protein [Gemmatimonadaceae bacterium]
MDVALTTYRAAIDALFTRTTGVWKLGLERVSALLERLGNPHRTLTVVHVGGTNGKGSVVATAEAVLRARGVRVGRYTSPHLIDFRERILVDRVPISEEVVLEFLERWMPESERLGATFFEITTALALDHFARSSVDVAIVEVGLGGRLDATNVVDPRAAVVTSIALDHTEWLGDSIEAIAGEKGGIFKERRPAVIGERDPAIAALLSRLAADRNAEPITFARDRGEISAVQTTQVGTSFRIEGTRPLLVRTPLIGAHQAANAITALAALDAAGLAAWPGGPSIAIPSVALPGRFQREGRWIFDVAHNPSGAAVLAATIEAVAPRRPLVAILGVLGDKDWRGIMRALARVVDVVVLTRPPSAPETRVWNVEEALAFARTLPWSAVAERSFDTAITRADELGATVLITGSFHTVGDAMARLQVNPLAG